MRRGSLRGTLTAVFVLAGSLAGAQSTAFQLRWEHDGIGVGRFEVCIDGQCQAIDAVRVPDSNVWGAPVPNMSAGEHRVMIRACNDVGCTNGQPELFVRVIPVTMGPPQTGPAPPTKAKPIPR
jgi:hypothetical protein